MEVFSDSATGALPAIWAKLPQSWILQGKDKDWKKITKKRKLFLNGKEQKKRVNVSVSEYNRNRRLIPTPKYMSCAYRRKVVVSGLPKSFALTPDSKF